MVGERGLKLHFCQLPISTNQLQPETQLRNQARTLTLTRTVTRTRTLTDTPWIKCTHSLVYCCSNSMHVWKDNQISC